MLVQVFKDTFTGAVCLKSKEFQEDSFGYRPPHQAEVDITRDGYGSNHGELRQPPIWLPVREPLQAASSLDYTYVTGVGQLAT